MAKYYSLVYIYADPVRGCYIIKTVKLANSVNIYDYLTKIYLEYKLTNDTGGFRVLCKRLDSMIKDMNDKPNINYKNVYRWIEREDCCEGWTDKIVVCKSKIYIPK